MRLTSLILLSFLLSPINKVFASPIMRVACVGDSITQGNNKNGLTYPQQLQKILGEKWQVENFGKSGRTLLNKGDFPYQKETIYKKALAFKPDVVVIKLGSNDTKPQNLQHVDDFVKDYCQLIESFQKLNSKSIVYICRPIHVVGQGNFNITDENLQLLLPKLDQIAAKMEVKIIDLNAVLRNKDHLIPDRVHPNAQGLQLIAEAVAAVITENAATTE